MVIAGRGNGAAQEILILIHTLQECCQEQQKPGILAGGLAGAEEVLAAIGSQGPVIMFTGTIDTGKRLFMKQANQIVLGCHFLHNGHHHLVVIAGSIGIGVNRCQLMLTRSALIVLGLAENTQTPELFIQVLHKGRNTGPNGTKIVVIQFLTLGGQRPKQSTACQAQIFTLGIHIPGQQKILLLRTHTANNALCFLISE